MAANSKTTAFIICICWTLSLVSSLPAPAEVSASLGTTGVKVGADVAAAANTSATTAAKAAADVSGKAQETGQLAATSTLNAAASTANKATGAASAQADSVVNKATGALSTTGSLASGALATGQNQLASTLGLIQAQSDLTNAFRNGLTEFVNLADRGTGQVSAGIRTGVNGGGGIVDGGFRVIGIQQPIATPAADAMWRIGESGRSTGFAVIRQGIDGSLYIVDPSVVTQPIGGLLSNIRLSSLPRLGTGSVTGSGSGTAAASISA